MKKQELKETDHVPPSWVDGKLGVTIEDWGTRQWESGLRSGEETGITYAFNTFMQDAAALWKNGRDKEVDSLRITARHMKETWEKQRKAAKPTAPSRADERR